MARRDHQVTHPSAEVIMLTPHPVRARSPRVAASAALLVAGLAALTACASASTGSGSTSSSTPAIARAPASVGVPQLGAPSGADRAGGASGEAKAGAASSAAGGGASASGGAGTSYVDPVPTTLRRLVRDATLTLRVSDLTKSADQVRAAADQAGGYVAEESFGPPLPIPVEPPLAGAAEQPSGLPGSSKPAPMPATTEPAPGPIATGPATGRSTTEPVRPPRQGRLVIRVPETSLDGVVARLGTIGTVLDRSSTARDVTGAVADLDSRIASQQASVERVRAMLASTKDLSQVAFIESELTRREADLEILQTQRAGLADQAALSTVTVLLTLPTPPAATPKPAAPQGFLDGLRAGWAAFSAASAWLLVAVGAVLPFAVLAALAAWGAILVRRRRRQVPDGG